MNSVTKSSISLANHQTNVVLVDRLHNQSHKTTPCTEHVCLANRLFYRTPREPGTARSRDEVERLAKEFFDEYFTSIKRFNSDSHVRRWDEVLQELEEDGTFNLTETELSYGAKLAWRNTPRCIGKVHCNNLQVFDARYIGTALEMFDAICRHLRYATNNGKLRSAITIFPQRTDGKHDFRIWNGTILAYAGYKNADGSILGDPNTIELTELGWKTNRTKWDILPVVVSCNGDDPEFFDLPKDVVFEVRITHPKYDWFENLGLRWYIIPAVSSMLLDCAGLEFTAAPFTGWYTETELGCRNLGDTHRYNVLEDVALGMGLETNNPRTLWKDRALVELNYAVLYSFQKAGATISDHHTGTEAYMKYFVKEVNNRGGCPTDWSYLVPPLSGSAAPTFHQEMALYYLRPSYEYQQPAWKTHVWKGDTAGNTTESPIRRKLHFREIGKAARFASKLYTNALSKRVKATILYATESGSAEQFAKKLGEIFDHAFNVKIYAMRDYDVVNIQHESLLLAVASTFGNGEPPENGQEFAETLHSLKLQGHEGASNLRVINSKSFIKANSQSVVNLECKYDSAQVAPESLVDCSGMLSNMTFAVFGLGSSAYPNFAAFGKYVDNLLGELGGQRLMDFTPGDELNGQGIVFKRWSQEVYKKACETFCVETGGGIQTSIETTISPTTVRLFPTTTADSPITALSTTHANRNVVLYDLVGKTNLNSATAPRITLKLVLKSGPGDTPLQYMAGDHVGIFAENNPVTVQQVLDRLSGKRPPDDHPVQLQLQQTTQTPIGILQEWVAHDRFPCVGLRTLLTRFLDITTPPRPDVLTYFGQCASKASDQSTLATLASNRDEYEHWKNSHWPDLVTVLSMFPSVDADASVLCAMLPPLQPRYYSVSSSPLVHADELHLTVAVINFRTKGGDGPLRHGVCSSYLNFIPSGTKVACFVRRAVAFHMPSVDAHPIIMVGPGTGIAPFRGFWQERSFKASAEGPTAEFGAMTLFFGCQTKDMILYYSEQEQLMAEGILAEILIALSRDPTTKKTYVQDLMREEREKLCDQILDGKAHIYICGDCTMAEQVYQTLKQILQEKTRTTDVEAEKFMQSLRDLNRYHEDIFGITHRTSEVVDNVRKTALSRIEATTVAYDGTAKSS